MGVILPYRRILLARVFLRNLDLYFYIETGLAYEKLLFFKRSITDPPNNMAANEGLIL